MNNDLFGGNQVHPVTTQSQPTPEQPHVVGDGGSLEQKIDRLNQQLIVMDRKIDILTLGINKLKRKLEIFD